LINDRLSGEFFKGSVQDFIDHVGEAALPQENTIFIGYNPGFGSGYDVLLESWCVDLTSLFSMNRPVVFTQANDYSDQRGELRVLQSIFEDKANFIIMPQANPFRAVTYYHEEGKKETSWSCSSTHLYAF
jgi:hypothetical protein